MLAKTKYFTESKKSRDEMQAIKPYFRKWRIYKIMFVFSNGIVTST